MMTLSSSTMLPRKPSVPTALWNALAGAPALLFVAGAAGLRLADTRLDGRTRAATLTAGSAMMAYGLVHWQLGRLFDETPAYAVERRIGPLEIRRYEPVVQAVTRVDGLPLNQAVDEGFRRLAAFIFGKNDGGAKIAMTTPVTTKPRERPSVAMTSPVTSEREPGGYTVAFGMPAGSTLESLPKPMDERIQLRKMEARRRAVLRFTGFSGDAKVREKGEELLRTSRAAGLDVDPSPVFAAYDAPTTLPFLRRNEVWVALR